MNVISFFLFCWDNGALFLCITLALTWKFCFLNIIFHLRFDLIEVLNDVWFYLSFDDRLSCDVVVKWNGAILVKV